MRFQLKKIIADFPVDVMEKIKNIRLHPSPDSLNNLLSTTQWKEINKNLLNTSESVTKWILQYITNASALLPQITAYLEKSIELHWQAQGNLLLLLFGFSNQNYSRYLATFNVENDAVFNFHIASTHQKVTYGEMERHEKQIQSLSKNLKTYVNPFHGAAKNMATGAEVSVSIVNRLLSLIVFYCEEWESEK